jgi:hypothetical protein
LTIPQQKLGMQINEHVIEIKTHAKEIKVKRAYIAV